MKLVENEIVVYNMFTKEIIMHFEYSTEQYMKCVEITNNMNECAKLRHNEMKEWYLTQTIYGVMYEENKSDK